MKKGKPKQKPASEWCPYRSHVDAVNGKRPKHVRCPLCRRRLVPKTIDCEPFSSTFDPMYLIPPHKIPYTKR